LAGSWDSDASIFFIYGFMDAADKGDAAAAPGGIGGDLGVRNAGAG
jgi:hypothetical protein